ncbi:MAG: hypothetical protein ABSC15_18170 [Terriglobales bacterium]|jgi:hypothetical protein
MSNNEHMLYPSLPKGRLVYETKVVASKPKPKATPKPRGPAPNIICYATTAFKDWKPGMKLPKCRVCGDILFPKDNHVCPGFTPKFVEHDEVWEQKQEAKRKEITESNRTRFKKCSACHEIIHDHDDACWHEEHCHADSPRGRHWYTNHDPIVGDNDGHECYEDYVEPDYCEGSDDGYDCD